jgi:Tol biopolymer transport system component
MGGIETNTRWRRLLTYWSVSSIVVLALVGPAVAEPGDITLASTSDSETKGNSSSASPSLSADGTKVAFYSFATNLDPADVERTADIYVKDVATGELTLASVSDTGESSNGDGSWYPELSADGNSVAFSSSADNLDPADVDPYSDVYLKDLATGDLILVSVSSNGQKGNAPSYSASPSASGSIVAFQSSATNLVPADVDDTEDIYVKDLVSGELRLASTSDTGEKANGPSGGAFLSADGTMVAFNSTATNLDSGDTDAFSDVYVKDLVTDDIVLISVSETGEKGNDGSFQPRLSAVGRRLAFFTWATNLDPAATIGGLLVKDLETGELTLASSSDTGEPGNGGSSSYDLSNDGTKVVFMSYSTNLDPADNDNEPDIFVKDLDTGNLTLTSTNADGVKGDFGVSTPRSLAMARE